MNKKQSDILISLTTNFNQGIKHLPPSVQKQFKKEQKEVANKSIIIP